MKLVIAVLFAIVSICYSQDYWEQCKGIPANANSIAINSNGEIFIGTEDGVFYSKDKGTNWKSLNQNSEMRNINSVILDNNEKLYVASGKEVYFSTNNGEVWEKLLSNTKIIEDNICTSLAICANNDILAGTQEGLFCYSLKANTWSLISDQSMHVYSLKTNSRGDIFVGTDEGLFLSSDKGDPWFKLENGLALSNSQFVSSILITSNGEIYAGTKSVGLVRNNFGSIFKSQDNGKSWVEINNGLPDNLINCIISNKKGEIFAGTNRNGVYRSRDGGESWSQIKNGLTDLDILSLGYIEGGYIFAGTDQGAFKWFSTKIIYVPEDYQVIQDAIAASEEGNTIIIKDGTYHQKFDFKGKAITVASEFIIDNDSSHIENTIIDGISFYSDSSSVVSFISGEDSNSILSGVTIQNGRGTSGSNGRIKWRGGGGILIYNSGATISNNIIKNNNTLDPSLDYVTGGGLECLNLPANRTLVINGNTFLKNATSGKNSWGGAINCENVDGKVLITMNEISFNSVHGSNQGNAGGICILGGLSNKITISNNFIDNNTVYGGADDGGGVFVMNVENFEITNNIIRENSCSGSSHGRGGGISVGYWAMGGVNPAAMKAHIINNTIINNTAQTKGGGIYVNDITVDVFNNIVRGNNAPQGKQINLHGNIYQKNIEFSNIEGGFAGSFNIDVDPKFCEQVYGLLTAGISECIDAGNPLEIYNDLASSNGNNLCLFPACGTLRNDMGAFGGPNSRWSEWNIPTPLVGIEDNYTIAPKSFSLDQNYPNPFNPTTIIKYQLPANVKSEKANVQLVVYDILGREVVKLVNQNQKPGHYEAKWNATEQVSGIYFYKLRVYNPGRAGDFVETKKMILLK